MSLDSTPKGVTFANVPPLSNDASPLPTRLSKTPTFRGPSLKPAPLQSTGRAVTFMPSQVGTPDQVSVSYTATPLRLLWYDLQLILGKLPSTTGIMLPWRTGKDADPFDEMYPNGRNIISIVLHGILIASQSLFLITLPMFVLVPICVFASYTVCFLLFNGLLCMVLNGTELKLLPSVKADTGGKYADEFWIFMNGVSVGKSWLQSNIDRLSLTFGRPVIGVHNPTSGIIFDLLQCLLQRNFTYATQDIREAYACIKQALLDTAIRKVVFILHSQGGIEGSLILDWLYAEVSRDALKRLEVYTFGNAANHFNDPDLYDPGTVFGQEMKKHAQREESTDPAKQRTKVLGHIEHYANAGDFVSQFGVLNYTRVANRYMGRLFLAPGSGHLLNQHYLYRMFKLNEDRTGCADTNDFMEMEVRLNKHDVGPAAGREDVTRSLETQAEERVDERDVAFVGDVNVPLKPVVRFAAGQVPTALKVKDFSRLWLYRNGGSPAEDAGN